MFEFLKSKPESKSVVPPAPTALEVKSEYQSDETQDLIQELDKALASGQSKSFDWNHYNNAANEGLTSLFKSEFEAYPPIRVLKASYARESWITICVNAVIRQFYTTRFMLEEIDQKNPNKHTPIQNPLTSLLNNPSDTVAFWPNVIADLTLAGNSILWTRPDGKKILRLPIEDVNIRMKDDGTVEYMLIQSWEASGVPKGVVLDNERITHIMLPNPYSNIVGLPWLVSVAMPILIDRYGQEFIIGFFLRGGNTTGILESQFNDKDQLKRLIVTIMQAIGSRRNMHADKILPAGVTWKQRGLTFQEAQVLDILDKNSRRIMALLGVPPIEVAVTESSNYANADAQMQNFWERTVLPLQFLVCQAILRGNLGKQFGVTNPEKYDLHVDNSHVRYLSKLDKLLEQDTKLKGVLYINERRARLGYNDLPDGNYIEGSFAKADGQTTPTDKPSDTAAPNPGTTTEEPEDDVTETGDDDTEEAATAKEAEELNTFREVLVSIEEPSRPVERMFDREFVSWEKIVLDNIDNKETAQKLVSTRAEDFALQLTEKALPQALAGYEAQYSNVSRKHKKGLQKKASNEETLAALRERSKKVIEEGIFENGAKSFKGYSTTQMDSVYSVITDLTAKGKTRNDIERAIKDKFGEFYEGQAKNIIVTEFGTAVAMGQAQFGHDLGSICRKMSKRWLSKMSATTRDTHRAVNGFEIIDTPEKVMSVKFSEYGNFPDVPYPKAMGASAADACNCQCQISYEPVEYI